MTALDFLAIRGLATDGAECFVGIGPTTSTAPGDIAVTVSLEEQEERKQNRPVSPPSRPPKTDISDDSKLGTAIWNAQNTILKRQYDYLDSLAKELAAKWEDVPAKLKDRTVKETMIEKFLQWLAGNIAEYFWGPVGKDLAELGVALIAAAIRLLRALYSEGEALCNAMKAENAALQEMEESRENYVLRSSVINQHNRTIQNLLTKIDEAEKQVFTSIELKEINETLKMMQAEEHIVECPLTGDCIYTKSRVVDINEERRR